jgi:hypothetical protein
MSKRCYVYSDMSELDCHTNAGERLGFFAFMMSDEMSLE